MYEKEIRKVRQIFHVLMPDKMRVKRLEKLFTKFAEEVREAEREAERDDPDPPFPDYSDLD